MSSQRSSGSRSSMFLVELIITIFFFSLASVVCVRLFLYAHKISSDSQVQTQAVTLAQNAAESFLASDGDVDQFGKLLSLTLRSERADGAQASYSDGSSSNISDISGIDVNRSNDAPQVSAIAKYGQVEGAFIIPFSRSWEPVSVVPDGYLAAMVISSAAKDDGVMYALNVRITDSADKEIYALEVLDYVH